MTFAAGLTLAAALAVPASAAAAAVPVTVPASPATTAGAVAAPNCAGLPAHSNFPVVDAAGVLDAQPEGYLIADLMRFAMQSDVSIVAATVPNLAGDDVASYGRRLFDCWGIGDADSDRGVLILAAMRERRVRIEIGRGLATEIDREELDAAVAAMTAPLRSGDEVGAMRAAAVQIATAVGKTLPDTARLGNGGDIVDELNIPNPLSTAVNDAPPAFDNDGEALKNPFRVPAGRGSWMPKAIVAMVVISIVWTFARGVLRGGMRLAGAGHTVWRGGFPTFGGGARGWSDPALLQGGHWSSGSSSDSAPLASGGGGGGSTGASGSFGGGSSSGSFGGGSTGGGGASGSW
jgi:uncharacterized protein